MTGGMRSVPELPSASSHSPLSFLSGETVLSAALASSTPCFAPSSLIFLFGGSVGPPSRFLFVAISLGSSLGCSDAAPCVLNTEAVGVWQQLQQLLQQLCCSASVHDLSPWRP
jgi:hypothetical protein